jgi:hypothetical protein
MFIDYGFFIHIDEVFIMKNDLKTRIKKIESEYPVATIEYKGMKIWPFIRSAIFISYFLESTVKNNKSWNYQLSKIGRILRAIKTTSLNILIKKRSSVLFTDDGSSGLRYIDGKLVDIFAIPVINYEKDLIPIVLNTRSVSITAFARYINSDFFLMWAKLYSCIKKNNKEKIINKWVLDKIVSDLNIRFDVDKSIFLIFSFLAIFRLYFKLIKPQKIFLICYYGIAKMAASYVAKEMKIPIIELQHGVIYDGHPPYFTEVNIEPNPYPDYLFVFGETYKKFVSPFICNPSNIFIIGNYYTDYIKRNKTKNKNLFFTKYNNISSQIIITVAGITELDDKMLEFIEGILESRYDVCFIYIPRIITSKLIHYSHTNIFIETELDVYQCMQNSYITSTVNSTCAIESLVFGTPVILINIQNLARSVYADFFLSSDAVFYADTPEEYASCITLAINRDRKQIALDSICYYAENPQECTQKAFERLIEHTKRNK